MRGVQLCVRSKLRHRRKTYGTFRGSRRLCGDIVSAVFEFGAAVFEFGAAVVKLLPAVFEFGAAVVYIINVGRKYKFQQFPQLQLQLQQRGSRAFPSSILHNSRYTYRGRRSVSDGGRRCICRVSYNTASDGHVSRTLDAGVY